MFENKEKNSIKNSAVQKESKSTPEVDETEGNNSSTSNTVSNIEHRNAHDDRKLSFTEIIALVQSFFVHNRSIIYKTLGIVGAIFLFIVLYIAFVGWLNNVYTTKFHELHSEYEEVISLDLEGQGEQLKNIQKDAADSCFFYMPFITAAKNLCLVASLASHSLDDSQAFIQYIEEFSDYHSFSGISLLTGFILAQAYENNLDLEKAKSIYTVLLKKANIEKMKYVFQFHQARLKFLQRKYLDARLDFQNLLVASPENTYKKDIENYLLLLILQEKLTPEFFVASIDNEDSHSEENIIDAATETSFE